MSYVLLLNIDPQITKSYPVIIGFLLAIASVTLAYYVAKISYDAIEKPMIRYGYKVSEKIELIKMANLSLKN